MRVRGAIVAVAVTLVVAGGRAPASAASDEDCRKFHQECVDARALGYVDAGICNVERRECPGRAAEEPAGGVGKQAPRPPATLGGQPHDPERSIGP
jgi:hypothetical protein